MAIKSRVGAEYLCVFILERVGNNIWICVHYKTLENY